MTDQLPELEPFDDTPPAPTSLTPEAAAPEAAPQPSTGGMPAPGVGGGVLPAPAYNPGTDKEYSRFLLAGMLMLIGCLMPWGMSGDTPVPGYYSIAGGISLLVAVGMVWTWWGAIATGRFGGGNLKWVFLSVIPLLIQVLVLMSVFKYPEISQYVTDNNLKEGFGFFGDLLKLNPEKIDANTHARQLLALIGPGRFVVLFGAVLAELFFLMAVFGGAKHAKKQKAARAEAKGGGKTAAKAGAKGGRRR